MVFDDVAARLIVLCSSDVITTTHYFLFVQRVCCFEQGIFCNWHVVIKKTKSAHGEQNNQGSRGDYPAVWWNAGAKQSLPMVHEDL